MHLEDASACRARFVRPEKICSARLNRTGAEILPYPLQRGLVRHLSVAAETSGRSDLLPLWAGQSAGLSTCTDVSVFLKSLLEEVSAIAGPISDWSGKYRENHPAP
jgi:nitronate monooxygenase